MNRWALRLAECATFTSKINRGYARACVRELFWRQVAGKVQGSLKTMHIRLRQL